jgi:ABC-type transport system involved in multi-copper enzyme maturation permease subunit
LIRLFLFEIKKLSRSSYFKFLLTFLLVVVISFYVYAYANTTSIDTIIASEQDMIYLAEQQVTEIKNKIDAGIEEPGRNLQQDLEITEQILAQNYAILDALEKQDWSTYSTLLAKNYESSVQIAKGELLQQSINKYMYPTPYTTISLGDKYKWMQQHAIKPVFPVHYFSWMTAYDEEFTDPVIENFVLTSFNKHSSTGMYFSYELFEYGLSLIGIIFLLFLFSDIVTKEGYGRNGPIQFLRTQPIKRYQILFVKLFTVLLISIFLIALIWGIALLLGIIFDDIGDWYYPVLIYGANDVLSFMAMGEFLIRSFSLFILLLLFSYSLLFFYSIITNRAILALGLTITTFILGTQIVLQTFQYNFSHWIPFHYVNVFKIVTNEYAFLHDQFSFSLQAGLLSLLISSIVLLALTFTIAKFRKGGIG